MGIAEIEGIDRKIAAIEAQRDGMGRDRKLRNLRARRRQIQKEYDLEPPGGDDSCSAGTPDDPSS